jgi:hypothetical protein
MLAQCGTPGVQLIGWFRGCGGQVETNTAWLTERYAPIAPLPDWRERLICSHCGSRQADMVVTGERR